MAEVKIQLKGEDNVTPVINAVFEKTKSSFGDMNSFMGSQARVFQSVWQGVASLMTGAIDALETVIQSIDDTFKELHEAATSIGQVLKGVEFKIDAAAAVEAIRGVATEAAKLEASKVLTFDVSGALAGVWRIKAAIDSIPDITTKTVIIKYKTQASPVMPFSEGIRYIKEKMNSLPRGGDYIFRDRKVGTSSDYQTNTMVRSPRQITFSPTINVHSASDQRSVVLARELDLELARMWRYKRSELRKAVTS